jgi:hypothetical protein
MNRSTPEKSTISSNRRAIALRDIPRIDPLRKMFSRPDSSGWKPDPTSSNDAIFPRTVMEPVLGCRISAMHFKSVDFPEPFRPMSPKVDPAGTSNETSRNAQKSSCTDALRRSNADFRDVLRS